MNTDKKKQHYIPKFYLRNFSFENNHKQIGIYHLGKSVHFPRATLKDQGTKNFFYGEDGHIEDRLSEIEGQLAGQIKKINSTGEIPTVKSEAHELLLCFVGLTHLRNPVVIEYAKQSRAKLTAQMLELDPTLDTSKLGWEMSHEAAVAMALSSLPEVVRCMEDLDYKLIINRTNQPFVTSDFPVVKYNQFLESKKWNQGKTGYGNLGLQIFIPIDPWKMIIFYDQSIYKVGTRKQNKIIIEEKKDVDQLNVLQVVNCFETVFFNHQSSEYYIEKLVLNASRFAKANQINVEMHNMIKRDGKNFVLPVKAGKENLMVMGTTDCETKLALSFIKLLSGVNTMKFDNRMVRLRPSAEKIVKNYHH